MKLLINVNGLVCSVLKTSLNKRYCTQTNIKAKIIKKAFALKVQSNVTLLYSVGVNRFIIGIWREFGRLRHFHQFHYIILYEFSFKIILGHD